jgi:hypothetical protein
MLGSSSVIEAIGVEFGRIFCSLRSRELREVRVAVVDNKGSCGSTFAVSGGKSNSGVGKKKTSLTHVLVFSQTLLGLGELVALSLLRHVVILLVGSHVGRVVGWLVGRRLVMR